MERITIKLENDVIYADIPFWSIETDKYKKMLVMVDTGATKTALGSKVLKDIGCYNENKKGTARTAGGFVDTYEVIVPKIMIGNMELTDIGVSSHTSLDEMPFDGIIGMNVLKQFNIHIDFDFNIITFDKRTKAV